MIGSAADEDPAGRRQRQSCDARSRCGQWLLRRERRDGAHEGARDGESDADGYTLNDMLNTRLSGKERDENHDQRNRDACKEGGRIGMLTRLSVKLAGRRCPRNYRDLILQSLRASLNGWLWSLMPELDATSVGSGSPLSTSRIQ